VLAEEQALELIVSVLSHLVVTLLFNERLCNFLVSKRVDHTFFVLKDSLDNKVLVNEEDISEASFASSSQAFDVVFFDDFGAADLRNQWMQIMVFQALLGFYTECLVETKLLII